MTDTELVLSCLKDAGGSWVADMYGKTRVMVHSRVAELRRRGYVIECRRFGQGDYRYRLVSTPREQRKAWVDNAMRLMWIADSGGPR